ncbi:ATP-dependent protease ATPase subunit HslU [Kamptonema cortianum]|nr:ATP-dependent protease ATPase subunit HslU [Geitlerinema splendidum]MDK3157651.1 ATP-dependent protease ATPase subunit HslU [Kamptonema cortianum]
MNLPIENLTPRQTVSELDKYIVGQDAAKRAVAVALRNRYRRQQLAPEDRDEVMPKNILMIGPTGVGKTEIARRLAQLARAPFVKVEATKFTEVGYVGRDVESMIRDLVANAVRLVEQERVAAAQPIAEGLALDRLVELLDDNPPVHQYSSFFSSSFPEEGESTTAGSEPMESEDDRAARLAKLRNEIESGLHDEKEVEIEFEEPQGNQFLQVFTPQGMEEMGLDINQLTGGNRTRTGYRRVKVSEARQMLAEIEALKLVDKASLHKEAVERTEQTGIVFIDEIDKVAIKSQGAGPDVSREGVQRDLLPIVEGSVVQSKFGPVKTDHILFIAAGAFHVSNPSDLIPELQGRMPIRVELDSLAEKDFVKILTEPKNALTKQYQMLLGVEGSSLSFTSEALAEIARYATLINEKAGNIGARRLHTLLERLLEDYLFDAPEVAPKEILVDVDFVREELEPLLTSSDLSKSLV